MSSPQPFVLLSIPIYSNLYPYYHSHQFIHFTHLCCPQMSSECTISTSLVSYLHSCFSLSSIPLHSSTTLQSYSNLQHFHPHQLSMAPIQPHLAPSSSFALSCFTTMGIAPPNSPHPRQSSRPGAHGKCFSLELVSETGTLALGSIFGLGQT